MPEHVGLNGKQPAGFPPPPAHTARPRLAGLLHPPALPELIRPGATAWRSRSQGFHSKWQENDSYTSALREFCNCIIFTRIRIETSPPPPPPSVRFFIGQNSSTRHISLAYADEATVQSPSYRRVFSSDITGSGSNLSWGGKHEGNDVKTAGFMAWPGSRKDCWGFKDCRLNPDTPGLITHTTIAICLRERRMGDNWLDIQKLYLRIILTAEGWNSRNHWDMRGTR